MSQTVVLYVRDKSRPISAGAKLTPERYSFHVLGGPDEATVKVAGNIRQLWEVTDWLRCPVEIYDDQIGGLVWWGYVEEIEVNLGNLESGLSLKDMANRVSVAYEAMSSAGNSRNTTEWISNARSVATYGTKELREQMPSGVKISADAYAARLLESKRSPINYIKLGEGKDRMATLLCKGWWETLTWEYYYRASLAESNMGSYPLYHYALGDAAENRYRGQTFALPSDIPFAAGAVTVKWKRTEAPNEPDDNVIIELRQGLTGAVLSTITVDGDTIGSSEMNAYSYPLAIAIPIAYGTTYAVVWYREGGTVDTKSYKIGVSLQTDYARGNFYKSANGSSWTDDAVDACFAVEGTILTTGQITTIIAAEGAFLTGSLIKNASGVYSPPQRDGDNDAKTEIEELLDVGTSNNRRLLAAVTDARKVHVFEQPAESFSTNWWINVDKRLFDNYGKVILPQTCPVGHWVQLKDALSPIESGRLARISPFFIERAEYDCGTRGLTLEPAQRRSPWDIARILPRGVRIS